jgi:site-specific recombinase XerD
MKLSPRMVELVEKYITYRRNLGAQLHSLRHTTAMHLLRSGVDITVIAL